jgi:hypothetical protein
MSGEPKNAPMTTGALLCAAVLLAVSIYGYKIAPPHKPDKPPAVFFPANGVPVVFPHLHHSDDSGGAFECTECHHKYDPAAKDSTEMDGKNGMDCRACHYNNADVVETVCADDPIHPRCIGKKCLSCHEGEECTFCHRVPQ